MKRINTVLLGLGLVFLVYLVWKVGWRDLGQQVSALGWGILLIILAEGLANLAHTVGWRHCIRNPHGRMSLWGLFRMNMAGYSINYLTPTASVGGEVSRAVLLTSTHKRSEAASSVMLDKLMTAVAHLVLVALGAVFLFWRVTLPVQLWVAMAITTVLLIGGMTVFLWLQKYGKLGAFCRWLVGHKLGGRFVGEAAQKLSKVDDALKNFYRDHLRALVLSVGWHVVGHAAGMAHAWLFLHLLHQPAPLATVAAAACLALWFDLLTFAIPMNLGTLEGSRIMVLKALGCQALLGMAFGVAVRMAQLFWAGFGLANYAMLTARQPGQGLPFLRLKRNGKANRVDICRETLPNELCYMEPGTLHSEMQRLEVVSRRTKSRAMAQ